MAEVMAGHQLTDDLLAIERSIESLAETMEKLRQQAWFRYECGCERVVNQLVCVAGTWSR